MRRTFQPKWIRAIALFLVGVCFQFLLNAYLSKPVVAQQPVATGGACAEITVPLTPEEQAYATTAWQYFVKNYQPATGLVNSVGNYPSSTLWDMGNYLTALNSARWLNLIDQKEFDTRLNKFLTTLASLRLFEDTLPNKVYNTATGALVDYGNNPIERGIGWSALDIGRLLAAMHIIRTCHPQYADWTKGVLSKWQLARSIKDEQMYGAAVLADGKTLPVQEGRLGYEEYAARGYELWNLKPAKALEIEPFKFVDVNGVQIPVDTRDYQSSNANNYVVSESYILDGIEFGLGGVLGDYAARVLEAQKRRYDSTGQLTAVSEDNLDQAPYFIYNTVYSNGVPWAAINEKNEAFPQFRNISTKAAFGWRYLYPDNAYAQKVFDAVKTLKDPENAGFYAGLYETTKQPNKVLTGNTNGLILEILYYKARGNRPLIGSSNVTFASPRGGATAAQSAPTSPAPTPSGPPTAASPAAPQPTTAPSTPQPTAALPTPQQPATQAQTPPPATTARAVAPPIKVAAIGSVGSRLSKPPLTVKPLTVAERRYAEAAWNYFKSNYNSDTGLVSDRSDLKTASLWGMGNYLAALNAARSLDIVSASEFDQRVRLLLGALRQVSLFGGELPYRGYDTKTLQPVDYGGNPITEGNGWSGTDVGRLLAALHNLKSYHPEYTEAVDQTVLDWSFLRVIRDGKIFSAITTRDQQPQRAARWLTRIKPVNYLGYEEYAARGFQLWGFEVDRSAVGGRYETATVDGAPVPTQRLQAGNKTERPAYTVADPFVLYALEFGLDPQMKELVQPMLQAQAERYRRTGTFTAAGTTLINRKPYIVHSTLVGKQQPWATLADDGSAIPELRIVSTAIAFAFRALLPENKYARQLGEQVTDLYSPLLGYYEGFYEQTGKPTIAAFSSGTNSLILQSLLYVSTKQQPLIRPTQSAKSPWWEAIAAGDSGRGLPERATQAIQLVRDRAGTYWASAPNNTAVQSRQPNL
ncbi:DUF3131 domain-containing protein [Trichocoleus sp. FACHB-591]|uniref:DUF3131 domain-containing protein n=1 Tax=Trichocoleus sp. FACHB-591 TaxID=2692872 RepID=UPI0016844BE5|nr:DUF3131 domain-containing protein [Trichocoleus sp. FACHB-591]MBD2098010.1 DUF3131 domain-containing protein [Trichocoleus sp. FACHB-591]